MKKVGLVLVTCMVSIVFVAGIIGIILLIKRRRLRQSKGYRSLLTALKRDMPTVRTSDTTRFEIPSLHSTGDIVNIEIQPSVFDLPPHESAPKFSTPIKGKEKNTPQIKFSVHYDRKTSNLEVELLDTKNITFDEDKELEFERISTTRHETFLTLAQNRRRRRRLRSARKSFNFELSYEEMQLQSLQFSVMCHDQSLRQKVIGDVILPMADLSSQGVDVTRELVMWRDVQTREMQHEQLIQQVSPVRHADLEQELQKKQRCTPS